MRRWRHIQPLLDEFQSSLSSKVSRLELKNATDRTWTDDEYKMRPLQAFPKNRGVYLLFNSVEELQYIGVAMWQFDTRVWIWDDVPGFDRRYIDVIAFPDSCVHFALPLEYFLICALKPPFNKRWVDYDRP